MSAFPPTKTGVSLPITQEIALKYLTTFLDATTTSPHLLPNARLEPSGPTAGSANSSIIIHNLQRVQAGLRGEWLAPVLDLEEGEGVNEFGVVDGMEDGTNNGQAVDNEKEDEGWMDLDQYQREQSIEGGDIGDEVNGVAEAGDSDLEEGAVHIKGYEEDEAAVDEDKDKGDEEEAPKVKKSKKHHAVGVEEPAPKKVKTSHAILPPSKSAKAILPPSKVVSVKKQIDLAARAAEKKARIKAEKKARKEALKLAEDVKQSG